MKLTLVKMNNKLVPAVALSVFFFSCKQPYDPSVNAASTDYLVVEGYIHCDGQPTVITLSRTRNITWADSASRIYENGAIAAIEDNQHNDYQLTETGNGNYTASYNLNPLNQYRIHIVTIDNRQYVSDFVNCSQSPPIDSLYWQFNQGSVWIYLDTHDATGETRFYRWDYTETWEYHSQYNSVLKYNPEDSTVVLRLKPVNVCYQTKNNADIRLASTTKLSGSLIAKNPLVLIPTHDNRISVLYSVIVTQFALDSLEYKYWKALEGNTENIGSIFSNQPDQLPGNIHNVNDPSEKVIGYIGAGNTSRKRIFIKNSSMPSNWNEKPNCTEIELASDKNILAKYLGERGYVPIREDSTLSGQFLDYFSASGRCVDCTINGGTTLKPNFWP